MNNEQEQKQLQALRDFFIAQNDVQLAAAYSSLSATVSCTLPEIDDWEEVEFAFNRLFIGPKAPIAPLFASVYLEPEPQVMGQSTLVVRRIFEMIGAQSPWQDRIPDDHLSMELDACLRLLALRKATNSSELEDLWNYFLHEHLGRWVPVWINRIRATDNLQPAILAVIDTLDSWVVHQSQPSARQKSA